MSANLISAFESYIGLATFQIALEPNVFQEETMKILLILVTSLVSAVAFAWPKTGDSISYDFSQIRGSNQILGVLTWSALATDRSRDEISIHITMDTGDVVQSEVSKDSLANWENFAIIVRNMIADCIGRGGTPERLATQIGPLDTCKFIVDDATHQGYFWYADVPFGWVKQITTNKHNGTVTELNVKSVIHVP